MPFATLPALIMSIFRMIVVLVFIDAALSAAHQQHFGFHGDQKINTLRPRKKIYQRVMPKKMPPIQPQLQPQLPSQPQLATAQVRAYHIGREATHNFGYVVRDPSRRNYQGRKEVVSSEVVSGTYFLIEADGSLRRVDYIADPVHGFRAIVTDKHGSHVHGFNSPLTP